MTTIEPGAAPSSGTLRPATATLDDKLAALRLAVSTGRPRFWAEQLEEIRDEAARSGFVWREGDKALFRDIIQIGLRNDLEGVETAPDARSAASRLALLESHAGFYGVTVFSAKIAAFKRQNQFDQSAFDLEEAGSHALESGQNIGDWNWSGAYASAGETVDKVADSGGHLLHGAAMALGIFN